MIRIVTVVGARPQFIKAATVSSVIGNTSGIEEIIVHTGQHYDPMMSNIFFEQLGIPEPKINLGVGSGSHAQQTGEILRRVEEVLLLEKPDWVLVYGDTNSTLAGALAAVKLHIPVAHVEAGLRSFNKRIPEEVNRVLTDHCSTLLFAPTRSAAMQLEKESIARADIVVSGDVMLDAVLYYGEKAKQFSPILDRLELKENNYVVCTIHRPENTDNPKKLSTILDALERVSVDIQIVLPVHPRLRERLPSSVGPNVKFIGPVGYLDMLKLAGSAAVVVTDSGGLQKESFFLQTPCVTIRQETEWTELIQLGWSQLVPPLDTEELSKAIFSAMGTRGESSDVFGVGDASKRIVSALLSKT